MIAIEKILICLMAQGHVLIEDVPGVGKTTLALALSRSISGTFHRIQFTSDLLPSDVLGVTIFNQESRNRTHLPISVNLKHGKLRRWFKES